MNSFKKCSHVAVFDVDGTLVQDNIGVTFVKFLRARRRIKLLPKICIVVAYAAYKMKLIDFKYAIKMGAWAVAGLTVNEVGLLAAECFEQEIKPKLYREALDEILEHHAKGNAVVLATGAHDSIARCLGEFVRASAVIATKSERTEPTYGWFTITPLPYREGKRDLVDSWVKENASGASTTAYTDEKKDLPLLAWADRKVAINGDAAVRQFAQSHGGTIRDFR